jgi:hypothetical protein
MRVFIVRRRALGALSIITFPRVQLCANKRQRERERETRRATPSLSLSLSLFLHSSLPRDEPTTIPDFCATPRAIIVNPARAHTRTHTHTHAHRCVRAAHASIILRPRARHSAPRLRKSAAAKNRRPESSSLRGAKRAAPEGRRATE